MRKRIFEIIEVSKEHDKISFAYDVAMIVAIIVSILPLAFKQPAPFFPIIRILLRRSCLS